MRKFLVICVPQSRYEGVYASLVMFVEAKNAKDARELFMEQHPPAHDTAYRRPQVYPAVSGVAYRVS